ncbi:MAG TPA: hemolysin family protein [Bacteroidales bacterium]|nr:hemolysin family protein [Bacteroidales bacterium]HPR58587.1 hemolysin family protein [Bacteroidales bacterium]
MSDFTFIIISLLLSAFFSGMEIAFISANRLKIEVDKSNGSFPARILSRFIRIPSKFIGAMLLGNNVVLVVYGILMARILGKPLINILPDALESEFLIMLLQTIIATIIVLFVAEFIPKVLFRINSNQILYVFALPAAIFYYLFYPVIQLFIGFSELVLKSFVKIKFSHEHLVFSVIDLDHYLKEFSQDYDSKKEVKQEIQMFQNAIDFRNIKLRECMVPRTEIIALEEREPVSKLRDAFISSGHSKIPIYSESIDNIIGYTHSADLFKNPQSIKAIMRNILVVPEAMLASTVLSIFIQENKSIAVVVDEFGGTSGLVTMEDVIEEIFGEIDDEFDVEELTEKQISENEFIFSARLEIDYLNEQYGLNLPESEEYETLAGLIIFYQQSIPELNETILINNLEFNILEATNNRIETIRLKIVDDVKN